MPNLIGPETLDTASTNATCLYPPKPLGAEGLFVSPNVYVNKTPLKFTHAARVPDAVPGTPTNPLIPCVIPTAPRVLINKINTTVHINGFLPMVQGDVAQALGTDRPFTGPFQYPNLVLVSRPK